MKYSKNKQAPVLFPRKRESSGDSGFTLVELAIVMVIIGILLGGVLKGQELITNAKASATVADIKSFEAATNTFRDAYDAIPGDMISASTRLPGCDGTDSVCLASGGNGDLVLGTSTVGIGPGGNIGTDSEARAFFVQLAAADLIGDVNPAAATDEANSWDGGTYPEAPLGGGFHAGWATGSSMTGFPTIDGSDNPRRGIWLALHDNPNSALTPTNGPVLQPSHALRVDNKMDDGQPATGFVRGGGHASCVSSSSDYNGTLTEPRCILYIRLGG